jgi:hypothetical protein
LSELRVTAKARPKVVENVSDYVTVRAVAVSLTVKHVTYEVGIEPKVIAVSETVSREVTGDTESSGLRHCVCSVRLVTDRVSSWLATSTALGSLDRAEHRTND